jgi:protein SCO1
LSDRSPGGLGRRRVAGLAVLVAWLPTLLAACGPAAQTEADTAPGSGGVIVSEINPGSTYRGAELATPYRMPDVALSSSAGGSFNLVSDTTRPVTLVFFGYVQCPDVCPLVMSDLTAALLQVPADVSDRTQLLFITTDPGRDTPEALRSYLDRYHDDFLGLTGPRKRIVAAAEQLGVPIGEASRLPGGGYDVSHGAQVIGFRGDTAPVVWTEGTPVEDLAADITTLARS